MTDEMTQIGKTIIGHAVLLAFLSVLLHVRVEASDHLEICKNDTWQRSENNHNWTIPSADCFSKEAVVVIRLDKVYLACEIFAHGYITISEFPSRRLCRLRNGTCFIFTNSAVSRRPLPFVKDCGEGQYWTFIDGISSVSVEYGQTGNGQGLHQTLVLTYVVYSLATSKTVASTSFQSTHSFTSQPTTQPTTQPTNQPTNQPTSQPSTQPAILQPTVDNVYTLILVLGALLGIAMIVIVGLAIRYVQVIKQLKSARKQRPEPEPIHMNEPVNRNRSSEREIVVNELYEMSC